LLRFLHVEARRVELIDGDESALVPSLTVDGTTYVTFDEAVPREVSASLAAAPGEEALIPLALDGGCDDELLRDANGVVRGLIVRERWPLRGTLALRCEAVPDAPSLLKLRVRVENASSVVPGERSAALRTAFVSTHLLFSAEKARFISVLDPVPEAAVATNSLDNRHVFPVLVGNGGNDPHRSPLVLSSPIILYDFPALAPQTDADAFDATEIDELLELSILSLPDAERDEARATDPRARAIVERAEQLNGAELLRRHGAIDTPAPDRLVVAGTPISKGSAVRLHPKRRADVWDTFLDGKTATVRAIHQDLDDLLYVAVTVDDDPASDLHEWYGRSFFFMPDEIEPLGTAR
ncbi:MAG TPA: hypothetical protein VE591_07010, partial [Candidatus Acidoferrum sp.]|nr:hypothetical protein [Candidatus Acidoferrum sp.]